MPPSPSSASKWKKALTAIIEELDQDQYTKMLELLEEIPKSQKASKSRDLMARRIIEHYGEEKSILKVGDAMRQIPRNDAKVQDQLRPFQKTKENKKMDATDSEDESAADATKSAKSDQPQTGAKRGRSAGVQSIQDLKTSGPCDTKVVGGKVVQKSGLRTYRTRSKEKKFFFYVGLADDTDCIKVMVYRKDFFSQLKEGAFYNFRNVLMQDNVMKVTKRTIKSKTGKFDIPKDVEVKAQIVVYNWSPVCSVGDVTAAGAKMAVSVEGRVKEICQSETVKLKKKRRKKEILKFRLEDETGSIWITLWGEDRKQFREASVGDVVKAINLKTSVYDGNVSLNSTDFTRIIKVEAAAVLTVTMEMVGIVEAGTTKTLLEAEIQGQVETFEVSSSLLANMLHIGLDDDFEEKLLEKIPVSLEAQIRGNQIQETLI